MANEALLPPLDGHRWISLHDEAGDQYLFDATFLLSGYHCIYGNGCPSIEEEPDHTETLGCCVHGAHFVDEEDLSTVAAAAALLDDSNWQFRKRAAKKGGAFKKNKEGDWVTRKADGACIFLNRDGFEGGKGCALHLGALQKGHRPLDWKPDVCWQVPIRFDIHTDDYGHDTVFVRAWERRDWGGGGEDFHWWCIEEHEAYTAPDPVYKTSRDELIELVGAPIYEELASELATMEAERRAIADALDGAVPVTLGSARGTSTA